MSARKNRKERSDNGTLSRDWDLGLHADSVEKDMKVTVSTGTGRRSGGGGESGGERGCEGKRSGGG